MWLTRNTAYSHYANERQPDCEVRGQTNERDLPVPSRARRYRDRRVSAAMGSANSHQLDEEGEVISIVCVGIDLAKNVFAPRGVTEAGGIGLKQPKATRAKLGALDNFGGKLR